jgi:hypothetical protein
LSWFLVCLDQMLETCSLLARLMISANSVRLSLLPQLFMNSTNFQQKILDYLISTISSPSFPHCEYRLRERLFSVFLWRTTCLISFSDLSIFFAFNATGKLGGYRSLNSIVTQYVGIYIYMERWVDLK